MLNNKLMLGALFLAMVSMARANPVQETASLCNTFQDLSFKCPSGKYALNEACYDKLSYGESCDISSTHHNRYCLSDYCLKDIESGSYKCGCQSDEQWDTVQSKCLFACTGICDYVFADANTALEHRWFTDRNGLDIIAGPPCTMTDYESLSIVLGKYLRSSASKFVNESVSFPDKDYLKVSGFTISLWTKDLEALAIGESRSFMQFKQYDGDYVTYGYQMGTSGYEMFFSIGCTISVIPIYGLDLNIWNHFYVTYAPFTKLSIFYLNEALLVATNNVGALDTIHGQTEVTAGFDAIKNTKLTGILWDLRIHNRPISIGEIKALGPE